MLRSLSRRTFWSSRSAKLGILATGAGFTGAILVFNHGHDVAAEEKRQRKERLVILGTGWAAMKFLKYLDTDRFDVSVVSPRNYFLFTPLLPSACVGTLDFRSIVDPVRKHCYRAKKPIDFYEASCVEADFANNTITCEEQDPQEHSHPPCQFKLDYDYLVVTVGAVNNTFNTPGVKEFTHCLKEITDAQMVRNKLMDNFEAAGLLCHSDEERKRLLSFVVVGGGPTGVEFAAELHDFVHEDLAKWYPSLIPDVKITLVQSGDHILNTYDSAISKYTEEHFSRENIEVLMNSRVLRVTENKVTVNNKTLGKDQDLPFGVCVWSTGIAPNPLVAKMIDKIPEQHHSKVLVVDDHLQVKGTENVFAMGDCSTIELKKALTDIVDLFTMADVDKNGGLSFREVEHLLEMANLKHPHLTEHRNQLGKLFDLMDVDHDGSLNMDDFRAMLTYVDSKLTTLPATAQVAAQEGEYLAKAFNRMRPGYSIHDQPRFCYHHRGSFA
eukprot:TRINITY_DN24184_c0_g1_i1.p1 TRINITY_DN24184_c0_g1~~TRINITY_DN24184_c0_g1_i1.p1  ORF type:complete len:509 (+),score=37.08 TRINITY_DN24184_c0_g1_i1:38-1528(+)